MSDRLAVFNHGKIEQVGSPAEVYESPTTAFVAGFVGVSNLISGPAAQAITGTPALFAVRPEKIHLAAVGASVAEGMCSADGVVVEVVYLGMYTRYRVALDAGGEMIVAQQNLEATSMAVHNRRGERVRLCWQEEHTHVIRGENGQ